MKISQIYVIKIRAIVTLKILFNNGSNWRSQQKLLHICNCLLGEIHDIIPSTGYSDVTVEDG